MAPKNNEEVNVSVGSVAGDQNNIGKTTIGGDHDQSRKTEDGGNPIGKAIRWIAKLFGKI